jgi:subtilisin family serine protease
MRFLRPKILLVCLAALLVGAGSASASSTTDSGGPRDHHTIVVKFDRAAKAHVVKLKPGQSVDQALATYRSMSNVVYAEANVIEQAQTLSAPNDPSYSSQWSLATTNAVTGWSTYPGSYSAPNKPQPPIAIVDSGIDSTHPDLAARVDTADGANCLSGTCVSGSAADDYGHGTHVAGIAAASANNLTGVAGVAFDAPLIPVKVLDSAGNGTAGGIAAGIIWAADHGARVVNVSLGSTSYSQAVCDAVTYATSHSALVVAAAGNNGSSTPFYPAACPGAIGVGATDSTDAVPYWSDTGSANVFVSAPGVNILSTYMGGGYQTESGTSMAAPFVSGLAELLLAQDESRTAGDVERILASTSDKVGGASYGSDPNGTCAACTWSSSYGYGRVNVANALTGATPPPAPDFTVGATPPSVTVAAGQRASYTVRVGALNGFTGSVSFSASGLPPGATASFSPTSVTTSGSSTLTIATSTTTPPSTYAVTIQGTSGSLGHSVFVTLVVAGPDFALVAMPSSVSVTQSATASSTISLSNLNGFKGTVSLSTMGVPTGTAAKLSRTSLSGTTTATLTLATTTSTPAGTYPVTVTGVSGSLTRTTTVTLSVAPLVPDFTLSASPTSYSVTHGRAVSEIYKITVTPTNGFKGTVSLAATGLPSNMTGKWSVTSISITSTSSATVTYTVSVPAIATAGAWPITVTATGGSLMHTLALKLTLT